MAVDVFLPRRLDEALAIKAEHPEALPIAGGTDLMVDMNLDRRRPEALLDVSRLEELREWHRQDGWMVLGSGVTFARIMREVPELTALAQASRTVGSPQIRNRATVGGNLGTASPAGDSLPVMAAYDAEVILGRAGSEPRSVPWREFLVGVKRTSAGPEELILGARWRVARGPGSFSKIGTRNAMVIPVANLCFVMDEDHRAIRVALGSVAPTVVRATEGEAFAASLMEEAGGWDDPSSVPSPAAVEEFGRLVAGAARPIDDVRGTAAYRRHACAVLARRAWTWAVADRREAGAA